MTIQQSTITPLAVSIDEAAQLMGVSDKTIRRLIATGRLRSAKVRRCRRVLVEDLRRIFEAAQVTN